MENCCGLCFRDVGLQDVGLSVGDNLVVSAENEAMIALSMGYVHQVTDKYVTMLLDR